MTAKNSCSIRAQCVDALHAIDSVKYPKNKYIHDKIIVKLFNVDPFLNFVLGLDKKLKNFVGNVPRDVSAHSVATTTESQSLCNIDAYLQRNL